jgi:hypothetical protein
MTISLNKYITKESIDPWTFYFDSTNTIKKDFDYRDSLILNNKESNLINDIRLLSIKHHNSSIGYQGFDREWVDDNNIKFIYYFDNLLNALNFFKSINDNKYRKLVVETLQNNYSLYTSSKYKTKWELNLGNKIVQLSKNIETE